MFPLGVSTNVRALNFSADGKRLWAGSSGDLGWLEETEDRNWTFHSLRDFVPPEDRDFQNLWAAWPTDNGALFVLSNSVLIWDGSTMRVSSFHADYRLNSFVFDGAIYVVDGTTGVYRFDGRDFRLLYPSSKFPLPRVILISRVGKDLYFITKRGPYRWDGSTLTAIDQSSAPFWDRIVVTDATKLTDGRIAVATVDKGVGILAADGRLLSILSPKLSRSLPTVSYSVFQDRDGGLWVTSPTSIYRAAINSSSRFYPRSGAPDAEPFLRAFPVGRRIILANPGGAYILRPDTNDLDAPAPGSLQMTTMFDSAPFGNTALFSHYYGLSILQEDTFQPFYTPVNIRSCWAILPGDKPGHFFVSTRTGLLDFDASTKTARPVLANLREPILAMAEDSARRVWMCFAEAGYSILNDPYSDHASLLPLDPRSSPLPPGQDHWLVGAANHALFLFRGTQAFYVPPTGLTPQPVLNWPNRSVSSFTIGWLTGVVEPSGTLWLVLEETGSQAPCVSTITQEGGHAVWRPHTIDGLWRIGVPTALASLPGRGVDTVIVAGSEGVITSDVAVDSPIAIPPRPIVSTVAVLNDNSELHDFTDPLPYSVRRVAISVAIPDYQNHPALRPEIFIEGIDSSWGPFNGNSQRELSKLRDGSYTARVRVLQTETGALSPEVLLSFQVKPPPWRAIWALAIYLVALAGAICFGYLYRERRLRRKALDLEEIVATRTEQLTKARAQADRANAAKSEFIARVSHNIRNPLNGIVGISLALTDTELEARQRELVVTLGSCARQLTSLIDDVLDFSRIEAGKVTLRPTSCSPRAILAAVASSLATQASSSESVLDYSVDPTLPDFLMVDEHRLQEILLNYVTNAIRYAPGHIVLRAERSSDSPEILECSVQDKGSGFTEQERSLLFSNFTRLAGAQSARPGGTGLGLALCKRLADLMGGAVGVETAPGLGSRFYVRLPLITAAPPPAVQRSRFRVARALIVEDADYNAWAFAAILAHIGVLTSDRAKDGREAMDLFAKRDYDVVLLDRGLPDIDGTEVAKQMRRFEADKTHALIICVSAYSTTDDRDLCLSSGMDFFAGKPLTPEKLSVIFVEAGIGTKPAGPGEMPAPKAG
jgi:signal transduction histidine kinase/CheY-like chemotaxis protein